MTTYITQKLAEELFYYPSDRYKLSENELNEINIVNTNLNDNDSIKDHILLFQDEISFLKWFEEQDLDFNPNIEVNLVNAVKQNVTKMNPFLLLFNHLDLIICDTQLIIYKKKKGWLLMTKKKEPFYIAQTLDELDELINHGHHNITLIPKISDDTKAKEKKKLFNKINAAKIIPMFGVRDVQLNEFRDDFYSNNANEIISDFIDYMKERIVPGSEIESNAKNMSDAELMTFFGYEVWEIPYSDLTTTFKDYINDLLPDTIYVLFDNEMDDYRYDIMTHNKSNIEELIFNTYYLNYKLQDKNPLKLKDTDFNNDLKSKLPQLLNYNIEKSTIREHKLKHLKKREDLLDLLNDPFVASLFS